MRESAILDPSGRPYERSIATFSWSQIEAAFRQSNGITTGTVTEPARAISAYYSCLTQSVQAFSTLPPKLWRPAPDKRGRKPGYKEVFKHALARLIDRPHPQMSGMEWRERWASVLLDQGDVFVVPTMEKAPDGLPRALQIYGRDRISPIRAYPGAPLMGWMLKEDVSTEGTPLPLDRVLHWRLPNPYDDVMGLAPKDSLRMALDADFARSVYDKSFYQNGANPSAILKYKLGELDDLQRAEVRKTWEEFHQGPQRAGRVAVVGGDWDFSQWSFQHSQAQYIEGRKLAREEIAAAFFGFPVEFLNAQENGGLSRAGEEMARLKLYENVVFPLARRFEPEFNYGLTQRYDTTLVMAFDTRQVPVALTYAKTESEIYERYVKYGIQPNQVIEVLDLSFDPVPGGDRAFFPENYVPIEDVGKKQESQAEASEASAETEGDPSDPMSEDGETMPATEDATRGAPLVGRLREKTKRILYGIRQAALKDAGQARVGATQKQWKEWARLSLPVIAAAVKMGADEGFVSPSRADLDALQANVDGISLGDPRLDAVCKSHAQRLLMAFNQALREAGRASDPTQFCGRLDQTAKLVAERAVLMAMAAGRKAARRGEGEVEE